MVKAPRAKCVIGQQMKLENISRAPDDQYNARLLGRLLLMAMASNDRNPSC